MMSQRKQIVLEFVLAVDKNNPIPSGAIWYLNSAKI
jgi:hypothetical protein